MKKRYAYLNRTVESLLNEKDSLLRQVENIDYRLARLEPQVWEAVQIIGECSHERHVCKNGVIVEPTGSIDCEDA